MFLVVFTISDAFENETAKKVKLQNILTQLRKCVDHPYLFDGESRGALSCHITTLLTVRDPNHSEACPPPLFNPLRSCFSFPFQLQVPVIDPALCLPHLFVLPEGGHVLKVFFTDSFFSMH